MVTVVFFKNESIENRSLNGRPIRNHENPPLHVGISW